MVFKSFSQSWFTSATVLICVGLIQGCSPNEDQTNFCSGGNLSLDNTTNVASEASLRFRNEQLLVTFKKGVFILDAQRLFGSQLKKHWQIFDIAQGRIADQSMLKQMMGDGRVIGIEQNNLNRILQPIPQCPRPSVGSDTVPYGVALVRAPQAWHANGRSFAFGAGVNVAVLDTGINSQHSDLLGRVVGGVNFIPGDGVPLSNAPVNEDAWEDDHGHGTEVAGVIGARANASGLLGVAPSVRLFSVKTQANDGAGSTATLIEGLNWAVANHMNIVNMSFGSADYSVAVERAVDDATASGLVLVAAAGNTGNLAAGEFNIPEYPAAYRNVISVGAVTSASQSWPDSTFSSTVDISAPGVGIVTTGLPTETNRSPYSCVNGTSLAAPHVSGVFALVKERFPALPLYDLKRRVVCSATDIGAPGRDDHTGFGLVNALEALSSSVPSCNYLQTAEVPVQNPDPLPSPSSGDAYFNARIRSMSVARVQANGQGRLVLTAAVVNGLNNPISSVNLDVQVETTSGQVLRQGTMMTDAQGLAQISLAGANCSTAVFRITNGRRTGFQFQPNQGPSTAQFTFNP